MKSEEPNEMIPGSQDGNLPGRNDLHLRKLNSELGLEPFSEKLPVEFIQDAAEGLNQMKDEKNLESVIQQLNKEMHQHLHHVKTKRLKRSIANLDWTYWAVIFIILLVVVSFIVIRMQLKNG